MADRGKRLKIRQQRHYPHLEKILIQVPSHRLRHSSELSNDSKNQAEKSISPDKTTKVIPASKLWPHHMGNHTSVIKSTQDLAFKDSIDCSKENAGKSNERAAEDKNINAAVFQQVILNQKTLLSGMAKLDDKVDKIAQKLESFMNEMAKTPLKNQKPVHVKKYAVMESENDLKVFKLLEEEEEMLTFIEHFSGAIGKNLSKKLVEIEAYWLRDRLFSRRFWLKCSWKGGSKERGVDKFSLLKYSNMLDAFKRTIRCSSTESVPEPFFKKTFEVRMRNRHAALKEYTRVSGPKERPKGLLYNRKVEEIDCYEPDKDSQTLSMEDEELMIEKLDEVEFYPIS